MARVVVVGGGPAGAATALALERAGQDVSVHEAQPDTAGARDAGAFLTLASNGMRALTEFGADGPVAAAGFPLTRLRVLDATGAEEAEVPLGDPTDPRARYACVRRADLSAALLGEVRRRGIPVATGARLTAVTEEPGAVTAHFADGRTARADLLVGADGLRSTVRGGAAAPRYVGQRVFYGRAADADPPTAPERITMVRGSATAFGYTVAPDGSTYWFARVVDDPLPPGAAAAAQALGALLALLRQDRTPAADIVAATGDGVTAVNAWDLDPDTPWRTARTLLVGDAAHAASPAAGQGASMAFEDAHALAGALRDHPDDLAAATSHYERLRRPHTSHLIASSARLTPGRA